MNYAGLEQYIPNPLAFEWVEKWLSASPIALRITRDRKTKLGDFRHRNGRERSISVNGTLSKNLFFFVLTHEIAHYHVFLKHWPRKTLPHGLEWKNTFGDLLRQSVTVYPHDFREIVLNHAKSPKANYHSDAQLNAYFRDHNETVLQELEQGSIFLVKNKWYRKGEKRRIKYICTELKSKRKYIFHPLTPIDSIQ